MCKLVCVVIDKLLEVAVCIFDPDKRNPFRMRPAGSPREALLDATFKGQNKLECRGRGLSLELGENPPRRVEQHAVAGICVQVLLQSPIADGDHAVTQLAQIDVEVVVPVIAKRTEKGSPTFVGANKHE